jgi:hypothetical protein
VINIDKSDIRFIIKIENPGNILIKNQKNIYDEKKNIYNIIFELKNIGDKYIKNYDNKSNILFLNIPMKKKGGIYNIIIKVDLNIKAKYIPNCPFWIKGN